MGEVAFAGGFLDAKAQRTAKAQRKNWLACLCVFAFLGAFASKKPHALNRTPGHP